ncbi:two-component response regulator-like APRR1 [Olea europaea subsp. europaea]|uniref:Two-component response regulator-like APRR1 n=1 Tax=Olea europaea subsp. europaea TaxID=158383 RepID=A0A8S0RW89_OLEEU|nr:two-component response regulator-like APRR1 [Olea europaea subsp. europaea]
MDKGTGATIKVHHIDRSKVRILLCDFNAESCQQILALLCQCSYKAAVWSEREIFDVLNSEGPRTDIILAEVNLLMSNDAYLLRYIMSNEDLQNIPLIILTTGDQDQVSVTVKGLRLGAVDYLVKPLHTNELSSLWMHVQNLG